jgi:long-chain fatty acid transport protein
MTSKILRGGVSALGLAAALTYGATTASATEGYFQTGYGVIQKAQAGAGVANPEDAMTLSVNPAGLVSVGRQFEAAFTLFSPHRDYTASNFGPGGFMGPMPGKHESSSKIFLMPNMAYSSPIDSQSAWGVALFGNGGMNTNYRDPVFGVRGTGVNLEQMFLTVGYARRMGDISIGIAPILVMQKFRADGLQGFDNPIFSANPGHVTGRGDDYSYGGGARAGIQWDLTKTLRFGLSGQSQIYSTKFDKYSGLFADGGDFDIPASITAGLAWDAMPGLTLMADYRHIFYSAIPAIANSSTVMAQFGAPGGPGFGWSDVDAVSIAAAWKATPDLTLRVGYSHNTNPVSSNDVMMNILAPGVVTDHFSAGLSYAWAKNLGVDLQFGYVPRHDVTGINMAGGGQTIKLSMEQFEGSIGVRYRY